MTPVWTEKGQNGPLLAQIRIYKELAQQIFLILEWTPGDSQVSII